MGIKTLLLMMAMVAGNNHAEKAETFKAGPVIVRMVGREKTLTIGCSSRGLAYSVADASGKTLLIGGTIDDLQRNFPDLWQQVQTGVAMGDGTAGGEILDASIGLDAGY